MKLSRKALVFSLMLHCSLACGGYFLWKRFEKSPSHGSDPPTSTTRLVVRPVKVKPREKEVSRKKIAGSGLSQTRPKTRPPSAPQVPPTKPETWKPPVGPADKPVSKIPLSNEGPGYPQAPQGTNSSPKIPQKGGKTLQSTLSPTPSPFDARPTRPGPRGKGELGSHDDDTDVKPTPSEKITRRAAPVFQPEFNLTARFPDLASVSVKVQFEVNPDGTFEATLLDTTGNPTADVAIIARLQEFKWEPALKQGVPQKDTRVIDVDLES